MRDARLQPAQVVLELPHPAVQGPVVHVGPHLEAEAVLEGLVIIPVEGHLPLVGAGEELLKPLELFLGGLVGAAQKGADVYDWTLDGRVRQFQDYLRRLEPGHNDIVPLMRQAVEPRNWSKKSAPGLAASFFAALAASSRISRWDSRRARSLDCTASASALAMMCRACSSA